MKTEHEVFSSPKLWRAYERTLLLLFVAFIAWQLFVPPFLGVADNNDFPKLMSRFCLGQEDHILFEYASFSFRSDPKYCWDSQLPTSAILPLSAAVGLAKVFLPQGEFDLRILGGVYASLFALCFWLVQVSVRSWNPWARLVLPPLVLLIFDTATHVPGFSTFYFDTASFVFLLLAVVCVCRLTLRHSVSTWEYLAAALVVVLLTTSKAQHTAIGLLLIPAFLLSFGRNEFPSKPIRALASAVIAIAAVFMLTATPRWYQTTSFYNALFYKCLPYSSDPAGDLAQLGIEPAMIRYVGQHAFTPDSPLQTQSQIEDFTKQISLGKLIRYYATHPRIAVLVLVDALGEGGLQRVRMTIGEREYRLGNYEKSTGRASESQSGFLDFWSAFKSRVFGRRGWLYGIYAIGLLGAAWLLAGKQPSSLRSPSQSLAFLLTAMVVAEAGLVILDGVDTGRHLSLFNVLLDLALCGVIGFSLNGKFHEDPEQVTQAAET